MNSGHLDSQVRCRRWMVASSARLGSVRPPMVHRALVVPTPHRSPLRRGIGRMNGGEQSWRSAYHRSPRPSPSRGTAPRGRLLPRSRVPRQSSRPGPAANPTLYLGVALLLIPNHRPEAYNLYRRSGGIGRMNGGGQSRRRPYHRSPLPSLCRGTAPRGRLLSRSRVPSQSWRPGPASPPSGHRAAAAAAGGPREAAALRRRLASTWLVVGPPSNTARRVMRQPQPGHRQPSSANTR
jgi:hypothetical protein